MLKFAMNHTAQGIVFHVYVNREISEGKNSIH